MFQNDDAELEAPDGRARSLGTLRGRVVVLFWESREHLHDNAELKRELEAIAAERPEDLVLLGVGDVRALDLPLVRPIVRAAVAAIAETIGHEILLDWKGALERPPFEARRGQSNVLILDREGRLVVRDAGPLPPARRAALVQAVRALSARAIAA